VTDHRPLLASLTQLLNARLSFRRTNLISALQERVGHASKTGNLGSGRIGIVMAQVYEAEAQARAELVGDILRQSRLSWSPAQIVAAQSELRTAVCDLFKGNLSQAADLSEQVGTIKQKRQDPQTHNAEIVRSFLDHTDQASTAALAMVEAVLSELVAAAANDIAAKTPAEHPTYIFQGPVGSFAQGNASVGNVHQTVGTATLQELADAVAAILRALPADVPEVANVKAELKEAETELRANRAPFARLTRAINLFSKAEDVAVRAPEAVHRVAELASMLGIG
jgi:hypothetical protein